MKRTEWLATMRARDRTLYDLAAPAYWVSFGLYPNATHRAFIGKLLARLAPNSDILDAACGAGRYDGMLLEAGHRVVGVDQSARMLARAREHFPAEQYPALRYEQTGLQQLDYEEAFDALICVDALEHIAPDDWPGVLGRFVRALRPGGLLYASVEAADPAEVAATYERGRAEGLPVVPGEVLEVLDAESVAHAGLDPRRGPYIYYHFHPTLEQVRAWLDAAGLVIEEEGTGDDYAHLLACKPG